ncbi:MAG: alpha/beta hydrolase [Rhodoferax sp.]
MTEAPLFQRRSLDVGGVRLTLRTSEGQPDDRPVVLLLHGFPQTHAMWLPVAQRLASKAWLVMPDLRGYGDSDKPATDAMHSPYSKRAMAQDMVALMAALGVTRFAVCGHDRGVRVAHRLALDHPEAVTRLALIDIVPTLDVYAGHWGHTDDTAPGAPDLPRYFALGQAYHHWFHLTQPAPLPEQMIGGCARDYLHHTLGGWGTGGLDHLAPQALADYERCFDNPATRHAMCEDYRAGASIDLEHDRASRAAGQHIACPTLVLWGERGVVHRLFNPLPLWQAQCALPVQGCALPAGHFIPEECPEATAAALAAFFALAPAAPNPQA